MTRLAVLALALMGCSNATTETDGDALISYQGVSSAFFPSIGGYRSGEHTWRVLGDHTLITHACDIPIISDGMLGEATCKIDNEWYGAVPGTFTRDDETLSALIMLQDGTSGPPATWSFQGNRIR